MKTSEKKGGRTYTSPLLLTGLLRCGRCGSSMVAATGKGGKYGYYVCAKTKRDGKAACPGYRAPVKEFEEEVLAAIVDTAFNMDNVRALAKGVRSELADRRRPIRGLKRELAAIERKLAMYYASFESGEMKAQHLEERVRALKEERNRLQAELEERQSIDPIPESVLERENIEKVQAYMKRMFWESPGPVIKQWLGLFIDHIVMRGDELEVVGKTAGVLAVLEQRENVRTGDVTPVRTSLRKWQPICSLNTYTWLSGYSTQDRRQQRALRFHPLIIAEWLSGLLPEDTPRQRRCLAGNLGISRARIHQYLNLLRLPVTTRRQMKKNPGLREHHLRALVV